MVEESEVSVFPKASCSATVTPNAVCTPMLAGGGTEKASCFEGPVDTVMVVVAAIRVAFVAVMVGLPAAVSE